jgi:hypothetical protein
MDKQTNRGTEMYVRKGGQTDRWIEKCMANKRTDRWIDKQRDREMVGKQWDREMDAKIGGQIWTEGPLDRQTDG